MLILANEVRKILSEIISKMPSYNFKDSIVRNILLLLFPFVSPSQQQANNK